MVLIVYKNMTKHLTQSIITDVAFKTHEFIFFIIIGLNNKSFKIDLGFLIINL